MSKALVSRIFIGSIAAVLAGAVVGAVAVALAIANHVFVTSGPDVTGLRGGALTIALLVLGIAGGLTIAAGMIGGVVAWIGALLNTWQLEHKTWFAVVLLLGIFSLGFVAMIGYVLAGPDGAAPDGPRAASAPVGAA